MPYCAAANCNNSTNKGFRLFAFPKDPIKREKWRQNCGRSDEWQPGDNHKLCEVHFDASQYETRALTHSGNKKLKPCAIPTLFDSSKSADASSAKKCKTKSKNKTKQNSESPVRTQPDRLTKLKTAEAVFDINKKPDLQTEPEASAASQRLVHVDASTSTSELEELNAESEKNIYEIKMERLLNKMIAQCTTIRQLRRKLLKTKKQLSVQFACVNKIFTQDQLKALTYSTKGRFEWSDETIKRSVLLRLACGPKGYNYLLSMGYPLPSYRTLCSRAQAPKQPKVLEFRLENLDIAEPLKTIQDLNQEENLFEM